MKVFITEIYLSKLQNQVNYISKDKPIAALKFKRDLIKNLKRDLKYPFIIKNRDIMMMKTYEIMFSKVILLFWKLNQIKI